MPRGGKRHGAGRKKEYHERVRSVLLGLPESILTQLDDYAAERNLSRPKAIAALLSQVQSSDKSNQILSELKAMKEEINKGT